ncbi:unnamed protein product [Rhodiola kirilowii]
MAAASVKLYRSMDVLFSKLHGVLVNHLPPINPSYLFRYILCARVLLVEDE